LIFERLEEKGSGSLSKQDKNIIYRNSLGMVHFQAKKQ
jgi:RNA polymerase sigma factor (sigma-70 family)